MAVLDDGKQVEEISRILDYRKSTVAKNRSRTLNQTSTAVRGRLQKFTTRVKRALARSVANRGPKTATGAARSVSLECEDKNSSVTSRCALKEQGLGAITCVKKPPPLEAHRRGRLQWALQH